MLFHCFFLQSSALRAGAQLVASGGASGLKSSQAAVRIASVTGGNATGLPYKKRGSLGGSSAGVSNPMAMKRDDKGMVANPLLRMKQRNAKAI